MPIVENSRWRRQFFEGAVCPDDVVIPTDDDVAYALYPEHRWVYNKLLICETEGLRHAPNGIAPNIFPAFSKPIYNLRGMGSGSRVLASLADYERHQGQGHFWMELLAGEHVSSDAAVVDGVPLWWRHALGVTLGEGVFDYWIVLAEPQNNIEGHCGAWLKRHLNTYSGMVNMETIGNKIIDVHLRFTDQWPDLYGAGWVERLVELYERKSWRPQDTLPETGYSVVVSGKHGRRYPMPERTFVDALRRRFGVSSIQITFHADKLPEVHAMPPGGFRLAIVNAQDLNKARACRDELAAFFAR